MRCYQSHIRPSIEKIYVQKIYLRLGTLLVPKLEISDNGLDYLKKNHNQRQK